jgi:phospholipid/cholesterol/gamma-HCH transport system substrate-binding protein
MRNVAILIAAVAAPVLLAVALTSGTSRYVVRAEFPNAAGLRTGFNVTLGGVKVGDVTDVRLTKRDTAVATLELHSEAAPVGRDAQASIQSSNLLGEKVVALAPGDLRRPAPSGTLIPASRTSTPVELDDVLNTLDSQTRLALGTFLVEQGDALVGRSSDLAAALERLPPSLDDARRLIAGLATDNHALGRLIDRSDRILAATARERGPLGRLVDTAGGALDTLASRRAALAATVRRTPGALGQLQTSLAGLDRAAQPLIGAARGLRASAPGLAGTLRALPSFTAAARPTLAQLRAASPQLSQLARDATPVVRRLVPASQQLATFARTSSPVTDTFDRGIGDVVGLFEGWARAIQTRDAIGHYFRLGVKLSPRIVGDLTSGFIAPPSSRRRDPGPRPGLPTTPQPTAVPAPRAPDVSGLRLPKLPLPGTPTKGGGNPVGKLLDFLLK